MRHSDRREGSFSPPPSAERQDRHCLAVTYTSLVSVSCANQKRPRASRPEDKDVGGRRSCHGQWRAGNTSTLAWERSRSQRDRRDVRSRNARPNGRFAGPTRCRRSGGPAANGPSVEGPAGSYGFDPISRSAGKVEGAVRNGEPERGRPRCARGIGRFMRSCSTRWARLESGPNNRPLLAGGSTVAGLVGASDHRVAFAHPAFDIRHQFALIAAGDFGRRDRNPEMDADPARSRPGPPPRPGLKRALDGHREDGCTRPGRQCSKPGPKGGDLPIARPRPLGENQHHLPAFQPPQRLLDSRQTDSLAVDRDGVRPTGSATQMGQSERGCRGPGSSSAADSRFRPMAGRGGSGDWKPPARRRRPGYSPGPYIARDRLTPPKVAARVAEVHTTRG